MGEAARAMIALAPMLDLTAAEPLQRALVAALATGEPIDVDGAQVERPSTASLQVLLAAALATTARGVPFRLREPSQALVEAINDLGIASHLGV